MVGQALGHYRIVRELGRGGMGEVYLAEDTRLKRRVALKILPTASSENRQLVQRFLREGIAASSLTHPNIAQIYDVGDEAGTRYIAMEYVEGKRLDEKLRDGPLDFPQILDMGMQIADALDHAHSKGVVHRDLKPQNIVIGPDGRLKILDFGLAKILKGEETDAESATDLRTESGVVMGTVDFMSPEQALGRDTDQRSDIFSAGVVLYMMATGRLPFAGATATEKIDRIVHSEPEAIARFNYANPPELERIIRKCLEKDRSRRYQSARELLVDLRNLNRDVDSTVATSTRRPLPLLTITFAAALVVVVLGIGLYSRFEARTAERGEGVTGSIRSIAVLPLTNASPQAAGQEYFADGLTELVTTELAKLPSIKVISKSSAGAYADIKKRNLHDIARDLKVEGIVEGTVVQAGDRIRITAQLSNVETNSVVWAETFQRTHADLFLLQSEIARAIATQIGAQLTAEQRQRLHESRSIAAEASQLYLNGRFEWNKRTPEGMRQALDRYQQALQIDPQFALAYVGIADYYNLLPFYSSFAPTDTFPKAKEAALKALQLDPSLPEAHASLAYIKTYYEWDWDGADKEFRRAIELGPSYADLHHSYSRYLTTRGRHDEAMAELRRAQELDPLSRLVHANMSMVLYFARRYDEAIEQLQSTAELDPKFPVAYWGLGLCYEQKGMAREAVEALGKAHELAPLSVNNLASLGHACAVLGDRRKAEEILGDLKKQAKQKYVSAYQFAVIHVGLGDEGDAMRWLERAYQERATLLAYVGMDPRFDRLRGDPRFIDLLRRIRWPSNVSR